MKFIVFRCARGCRRHNGFIVCIVLWQHLRRRMCRNPLFLIEEIIIKFIVSIVIIRARCERVVIGHLVINTNTHTYTMVIAWIRPKATTATRIYKMRPCRRNQAATVNVVRTNKQFTGKSRAHVSVCASSNERRLQCYRCSRAAINPSSFRKSQNAARIARDLNFELI